MGTIRSLSIEYRRLVAINLLLKDSLLHRTQYFQIFRINQKVIERGIYNNRLTKYFLIMLSKAQEDECVYMKSDSAEIMFNFS